MNVPDPLDGAEAAVVRSDWVPVRSGPDHRSEMTSQWLCGELLRIEERRDHWARTRGPDGYAGWTHAGGLHGLDPAAAAAWDAGARWTSLGTALEGEAGTAPRRLPWGARAVREEDGSLVFPWGARARPERPGRVIAEAERRARFPARAEAVLRTARLWLGAPYLWGGRTPEGADCSGFVQAVLSLHGVELPRDSRDQARVPGRLADSGPATGGERGELRPEALRPGDLAFFAWGGAPVSHVAIVVEDGRLLHAAESLGRVGTTGWEGPGPPLSSGLIAGVRLLS